jgi:hypothetical protein
VKSLRGSGLLEDSIHTSVEEHVAMFIHVIGHNQRFRVIHTAFIRSMETISRYFSRVLYAIGELGDEMIKPPSSQTPPKILNSFRWMTYFKANTCTSIHGFTSLKLVHKYDFAFCSSCRIVLVLLTVLTSLPEVRDQKLQLTGARRTTQARMCWFLLTST